MTIAFKLALVALMATSSILLFSAVVVFAFASPDGWSSNKNVVLSGTSLFGLSDTSLCGNLGDLKYDYICSIGSCCINGYFINLTI